MDNPFSYGTEPGVSGSDDNQNYGSNQSSGMNPWQWGAAGVGAGSLLAKLFGSSGKFTNPANGAQSYLDKIPDALKPYFQSFIDRGNQAGTTLNNQYGAMTSDPSAFLANIGKNYSQSPGYQFNLKQALQGSNNAAAAGGALGSGANQQQNATVAEGLSNQDYNQWLDHALGIFGMGQQGLQGEETQGYNASNEYGTDLANWLGSESSLAYRGGEEQNKYNEAQANAQSGAFGDIAGFATKMLPYLAGL